MSNMGSEDHMDYTVIGDSINVAARLCGAAQPGQLLVSSATAEQIGRAATWKDLPPVTVKGKDHPTGIVEPAAIKGGSRRHMRKATDIPVDYFLKGFSDESKSAIMRNISAGGCPGAGPHRHRIEAEPRPEHRGRRQDFLYSIGLCFENLPRSVHHRVVQWIHRMNTEIGEGLFL